MEEILIRPAKKADAPAICKLVNHYAKKGKLLRRTTRDVQKNIRDFFVADMGGKIVGCAALDIYNRKMAEIRSLSVDEKHTSQGIGRLLVAACVERAKKRKILEVMAITSQEHFFQKSGFAFILPGERKALFVNP